METGRTFATLFADMDLRQRLLMARTEEDFKRLLWEHTKELAEEQSNTDRKNSDDKISNFEEESVSNDCPIYCVPGMIGVHFPHKIQLMREGGQSYKTSLIMGVLLHLTVYPNVSAQEQ